MLYRGVSKVEDERNKGRLVPKGTTPEVVLRYDGSATYDGTYLHGPSVHNTARAHHIDTGRYDGSGISATRSEMQAIKFATTGGLEDGFVYVIDETKLEAAGVSAVEFSDPLHPHEQEVTLIERSGNALPDGIVVEKYAVDSSGKRTVADALC